MMWCVNFIFSSFYQYASHLGRYYWPEDPIEIWVKYQQNVWFGFYWKKLLNIKWTLATYIYVNINDMWIIVIYLAINYMWVINFINLTVSLWFSKSVVFNNKWSLKKEYKCTCIHKIILNFWFIIIISVSPIYT